MGTFTSTRGNQASLEAALFEGLAQDGGLYMPDPMPRVRPLSEHGSKPAFLSVACKAASDLLEDSLPSEITTSVVADSLTFPVPLIEVDPGVHVLELFHGPTHAFKDFGARFMARLMSTIDPYDINSTSPRTVLVATSGDTGSAVANAFHRLPGYRVVVLFPRDGVSARQRRQMTTLGDNVTSVAVAGTFHTSTTQIDLGQFDQHRQTLASSSVLHVRRGQPGRPSTILGPLRQLGQSLCGDNRPQLWNVDS